MRISSAVLLAALSSATAWQGAAQVLSPAEIADPGVRAFQQSHLADLRAITTAVAGHKFPYHFYFSRRLDLSEREQEGSDQRAVQFDRFQGQLVLKMTGNYFAAYSAERMTREERFRQTYQDVMLPLLQAAVPALAKAEVPDAYALEVSHHVRRKVMGMNEEYPENVVLILPRASAQRLIAAPDEAGRMAAVLEGRTYFNGAPISLWPGAVEPERSTVPVSAGVAPRPDPSVSTVLKSDSPGKPEAEYRDTFARMLKELDSQAHFVSYAPPSFISFRGGQYLQIPLTTTLSASDSGSQYKLAALAFDRHIAHLIRPVLGYFKDSADFPGIDFSTAVRVAGADSAGGGSEAVEFIFPMSALRSYEKFDLTGQQLIDAGIVLINGERAGVDLQVAEAQAGPQ